jgi:predicted DCC family thiol-disulfide oxidoreductase YuxK
MGHRAVSTPRKSESVILSEAKDLRFLPASANCGRALMLYDGVCGLCNWVVRGAIRRDRHDRLRFAPQQSALAEAVLARHGIDREAMLDGNSVYLALDFDTAQETLLRQSDVPVNVLLLLGGVSAWLGRLLRMIPKPLRDWSYRVFARNRYRVSPRYESCPLPTAADRAKFLGEPER